MLSFVARFLGLWFWAGAVVAAIYDGTKSLAATHLVTTPLGETWFALHPASLNGLQVAIERHLADFLANTLGGAFADIGYTLWNPVIQTVLQSPSWLVFGVLGLVFLWAGRKRERTRRVSVPA